MKKIQLGHKQKNRKYKHPVMWALVDDEDFEELNQYTWCVMEARNVFYAVRRRLNLNGKWVMTLMHTQLMQTPKGKDTDHIDGSGLNNQRNNLRICTRSQNIMNQGKQSGNTSGFKGVTQHRASRKWFASITVNKKQIYLGRFQTPELASEAYIEACKKHHGEFANY